MFLVRDIHTIVPRKLNTMERRRDLLTPDWIDLSIYQSIYLSIYLSIYRLSGRERHSVIMTKHFTALEVKIREWRSSQMSIGGF